MKRRAMTSRRRFPRYPCDVAVRIGPDNAPFASTSAADLSAGGLGLAAAQPLEAGTSVDLWVDSPGRAFYARGCVAHVQPGARPAAGVELIFASLRERRLMADEVKRLAAR